MIRFIIAALALVLLAPVALAQELKGPLALPASGSSGGTIGTDTVAYYVDATLGNDSASCLASGASACLTIQAAFNKAIARSHAAVTINIADGTYTTGLSCNYPPQIQASGGILINGNVAAPNNVLIDTTAINNNDIAAQNGCVMTIQGLKLKAAGSAGSSIVANTGGTVYGNNLVFASVAFMHMDVYENGVVVLTGNTAISGGGVGHYHAHLGGLIVDQGNTVTLSPTPTFTSFFAGVAGPGMLTAVGTTYVGTATGLSLLVHNAGFVDTGPFVSCLSFFPGTAASLGTTSIDATTFGTCGTLGFLTYANNSGLNAQEISPTGAQNFYLHGTGGGGMRLGAGVWLGSMFDSTGTPTITSGNCGAAANGTIAGDNMSGTIIIGAAATTTCRVDFSGTLPNIPHSVMLTPNNSAAAGQVANVFVSTIAAADFIITGTALANTTWGYQVR